MAKTKEEVILVQEGDQVVELTGAEKEAFLTQLAKDQTEADARQAQIETQKELKISAYTKLGLTKEEINAIL